MKKHTSAWVYLLFSVLFYYSCEQDEKIAALQRQCAQQQKAGAK